MDANHNSFPVFVPCSAVVVYCSGCANFILKVQNIGHVPHLIDYLASTFWRSFQVKLSIAGKTIIREEDLDKADSDSLFDDLEISSVSGSGDETENAMAPDRGLSVKRQGRIQEELYFRHRWHGFCLEMHSV